MQTPATGSTAASASTARAQRSLGDPALEFPLLPVLSRGCPVTSNAEVQYPLEIAYDLEQVSPALFDQPPLPGLDRWQPLLPPLAPGLAMAEGGTPLLAAPALADWAGFAGELFVKDESRNPTWSHKDRLNLCAISAAVAEGAPGVVVASSGNHGAAAAAYAARAGLPCIVLTSDSAPPAVQSFLLGYGAAVVGVPTAARWTLVNEVVTRLGYHPVTNLTGAHTGHPWGPEGYKTLAYELVLQLGRRVPAAVFVPTGYGELLFGVWKGFRELVTLGVTPEVPRIIACEPEVRAPLRQAIASGAPFASVPATPTDAYAIACTVSSFRGVRAVRDSEGLALGVTDSELVVARDALARSGMWVELSSAAGLAGLRQLTAHERFDGPVVAIATSSGFKDITVGHDTMPLSAPEWDALARVLRERYGVRAS